MTKREIVFDWLSLKANRERLPILEWSEHEYYYYDNSGDVLKYSDGCNVAILGKTYYQIKLKQ